MSHWQGKTVVVTGGSAGLGLAIAKAFAKRQAKLVLLARDSDALKKAKRELKSYRAEVTVLPTDITEQQQVQDAFEQIRCRSNSIDALVNAAGLSARKAVLDTSPEDFQTLWNLNFLGTVRCIRAVADDLAQSKGHLVNIGSLASKTASRFLGAYPATKFAIAGYTHQLRLELQESGVHVLLVCPGPIRRDDAGSRYDQAAADLPATARQPGGGARVKAIAPADLSERIIKSCEQRRPELIVPSSARWLFAIAQLWPSVGDWILARKTSSSSD
ncbi:MAG: SDR family NAD(P)-dependent oxidoreductase [Pirellulaceae bacterium]|nr:SDR family NAD(P)-dependent oxidoreductase [Pirellulaceae bacterium]